MDERKRHIIVVPKLEAIDDVDTPGPVLPHAWMPGPGPASPDITLDIAIEPALPLYKLSTVYLRVSTVYVRVCTLMATLSP